MNSVERVQQGIYMLMDEKFAEEVSPDWFDPEVLSQQGLMRGEAQGRGSAWFITLADQFCVLRHYFRGGLVGKVSRDRFVWNGLSQTRAWREWVLLASLQNMGLPAPVPMAAAVQRSGMFYSCDLITHQIPNTSTLADCLSSQPLSESVWKSVGDTIARFHQQSIWHADLNARNILLDEQHQVFLIDFDKARKRAIASSWQHANLERLLRSLRKFLAHENVFHFGEKEWGYLLDGYQSH